MKSLYSLPILFLALIAAGIGNGLAADNQTSTPQPQAVQVPVPVSYPAEPKVTVSEPIANPNPVPTPAPTSALSTVTGRPGQNQVIPTATTTAAINSSIRPTVTEAISGRVASITREIAHLPIATPTANQTTSSKTSLLRSTALLSTSAEGNATPTSTASPTITPNETPTGNVTTTPTATPTVTVTPTVTYTDTPTPTPTPPYPRNDILLTGATLSLGAEAGGTGTVTVTLADDSNHFFSRSGMVLIPINKRAQESGIQKITRSYSAYEAKIPVQIPADAGSYLYIYQPNMAFTDPSSGEEEYVADGSTTQFTIEVGADGSVQVVPDLTAYYNEQALRDWYY